MVKTRRVEGQINPRCISDVYDLNHLDISIIYIYIYIYGFYLE